MLYLLLLIITNVWTLPLVRAEQRIVYGNDNRLETFEANEKYQKWAKSTAGMVDTLKLIDLGTHFMLPPSTLSKNFSLCQGERFEKQPTPFVCSGFLIGPDLLVTAGHCVRTQEDCKKVSWIFDFKLNAKNLKANIAISKENTFTCKKLIEARLEGRKDGLRDYALIRLNKAVQGRKPLRYRMSGKIKKKTELVIIGHPSGLPQKIADKGFVFENGPKHFFKTNLDSFGGNSGSAVLNAKTGEVEGILVRGAIDYVVKSCGVRVNQVKENIEGKKSLGESVSRITDLDAINKRSDFLSLLKRGALSQSKKMLLEEDQEFLLGARDQKGNSPLHIAVKSRSLKLLKMLIAAGGNINTQNDNGETPLHLAAFINNKRAVMLFVETGADLLIKDKYNAYASGRTNYFAFKLRSYLRKLEKKQKTKKK